ncbi:MAG: 3-deoxy-7-phosphoheptulonate synthase [Bacteroidetes bacterium]|nr:MAG: 3-deoxy-7-phosphoheptulonate synthase [Bacteroidota bacterium]
MNVLLNTIPLENWLSTSSLPLVIAGPCSAESEEQVMQTAGELAKIPMVRVFRAGLWKPRTRPGEFEGVGDKGLKWLVRVKQETGLLVTTEVASPFHVEKALTSGIDMVWLGARTVVNPFSVQEIGEALKGSDIPVLVKNPLNPDLTTWMGALERINRNGIRKLAAIHRGFSYYKHSPYRNDPMWEIPIELKRLCPELPVIVDPSHICGNYDLLLPISQRAIDLEMNGLMIESHIRPQEALTDRQQQITPDRLAGLLGRLILRNPVGNDEFQNQLEKLRSEIDKIDQQLIDIITQRMAIVDQIGTYKKENKITILQLKRWNQIFRERLESGLEHGLSRDFIMKLLEAVHEESIQRQINVMNKKD